MFPKNGKINTVFFIKLQSGNDICMINVKYNVIQKVISEKLCNTLSNNLYCVTYR